MVYFHPLSLQLATTKNFLQHNSVMGHRMEELSGLHCPCNSLKDCKNITRNNNKTEFNFREFKLFILKFLGSLIKKRFNQKNRS